MLRNPTKIDPLLYVKDDKYYCKVPCIIEFPKWYQDKELATIGEVVSFYGIFAILVGDNYSVSLIPTMVTSKPIMVKEVTREGVEYIQLMFGKDDPILESTKAVKNSLISFRFFESYFTYAKVPWFIEYEDLPRLMDNLVPYAGSNVGDNYIANELVSSFITRAKDDKKMFYRQVGTGEYTYIELLNVYYSALSGLTAISGAYFNKGVVSNIVDPRKTKTKIEELIR